MKFLENKNISFQIIRTPWDVKFTDLYQDIIKNNNTGCHYWALNYIQGTDRNSPTLVNFIYSSHDVDVTCLHFKQENTRNFEKLKDHRARRHWNSFKLTAVWLQISCSPPLRWVRRRDLSRTLALSPYSTQ